MRRAEDEPESHARSKKKKSGPFGRDASPLAVRPSYSALKARALKTRPVKLIQHPTATHPDPVTTTKSHFKTAAHRSRSLGVIT
ncbi:hypothetical protein EYF80_020503 [Liparis tanakae]|uniref:Uncharacterized protein n=1 Tax=Liparis tanakae TaxID=230148 RepID=A0A4Z2HTK8_9TELE|nr:hypothetical protein EYF80_020503 [Liparis tanakae]